jgi:hypothetical protein
MSFRAFGTAFWNILLPAAHYLICFDDHSSDLLELTLLFVFEILGNILLIASTSVYLTDCTLFV